MTDHTANACTVEGLLATADDWDLSMVSNDADAIGEFMAESWQIIGADGGVTNRGDFLSQIRSGVLSHDTMTTEHADVRIFGTVGVLVARGVSAGVYDGHRFRAVERQSSVFVYEGGRWQCVLTHLSALPDSAL